MSQHWHDRAYELWPDDTDEHQRLRAAFYQGGEEQGFPTAKALKIMNLMAGDRLILKFKYDFSEGTMKRIKEYLSEFFIPKGVTVAVVGNDPEIFIHCSDCPHWEKRKKSKLMDDLKGESHV